MNKVNIYAFADEACPRIDGQIDALCRNALDGLEIRGVDGTNISDITLDKAREVRNKLDASGLTVFSVGSPIGKIALDGDLEGHLALARNTFEAARTLGTRYVRMFSFYAPAGKCITECRSRVLEALGRLLDLADEYGVVLCHENEAAIFGDTPQRCLELIRYFEGRLRCVFDMGNFVLEGVDPTVAYRLLQPHIAYFHIKDALGAGAVVPPGKGEACIGEILRAHSSYAKEDFFVSLEPHLQTFDGLNALVGRSFENPYQYPDARAAFEDAVHKFREMML